MWEPLRIANVSYTYLQTMKKYTLIYDSTFDRDFGKLRLTFNDAKDYCDKFNARWIIMNIRTIAVFLQNIPQIWIFCL